MLRNSVSEKPSSPMPPAYRGPSDQKAPVTSPAVTDPPTPTWDNFQTLPMSMRTLWIGAGADWLVSDTGIIASEMIAAVRVNSWWLSALAMLTSCCPTMIIARLMTVYRDSTVPRVRAVERSLSQLSMIM